MRYPLEVVGRVREPDQTLKVRGFPPRLAIFLFCHSPLFHVCEEAPEEAAEGETNSVAQIQVYGLLALLQSGLW